VALAAEHFCAACRTPFLNAFPLDENGLCGLCRLGLTDFDRAYSFGSYEGELRALIHLFKYGKIQTLARPLGSLLVQALPREQTFDVITPLPLHWFKRWQRGFNQSELLAKEISRRTGVPVSKVVRRVRSTVTQAGLTNAKRRDNVARAFRANSRRSLQGLRVLLIDDVMTTGATAAACAAALKKAGARHITLLTLARVDRRFAAADRKDHISTDHISTDQAMSPDTPSFPELPFSGSFEDAKSGSTA
jgi:ComF family protein